MCDRHNISRPKKLLSGASSSHNASIYHGSLTPDGRLSDQIGFNRPLEGNYKPMIGFEDEGFCDCLRCNTIVVKSDAVRCKATQRRSPNTKSYENPQKMSKR